MLRGYSQPSKMSDATSHGTRYLAADLLQDIQQVIRGELQTLRQNEVLTSIVRNIETLNNHAEQALGYLDSIDRGVKSIDRGVQYLKKAADNSLEMQWHSLKGIYALGQVVSSIRIVVPGGILGLTPMVSGPTLSFEDALRGYNPENRPRVQSIN